MSIKINKKENFIYQDKIDLWKEKKTKLNNIDDLSIIKKFLIFNNIDLDTIKLSNDYIFRFYNLKTEQIKKLGIRGESIFKLSIYKIINRFIKYFINELDFKIKFEESNKLEEYNETKILSGCCIHDVLIEISKKNDSRQIIVIFEYNEKNSHDKVYDNYKKIKTLFNSNLYICYEEKNENSKKYCLYNSIKKFIMNLFIICCTLTNNKYILSKIIYFESLTNLDDEILEIKTNIFNYIVNIKNNKTFDLKKLYLELNPYNLEGNEYNYKEFVKLLKSDYKIDIKYSSDSSKYDSKYFSEIMIFVNLNISDNIKEYKEIYLESINALDRASNKIIEFNKNQYNKMDYFPEYLKNYIRFDLIKNRNKPIIKELFYKLKLILDDDDNDFND